MKRIFLLTTVALLSLSSFAQDEGDDKNLVQNPSFEAEKGKLKKLNQINVAAEWESPTALRADLFSMDKPAPCSAPENQYGKETPYDGTHYAGIVMYSYNNKDPRTYLQSKLIAPLRKDVEYCVKFYVSLADLSKYAVNNFGIYFGKEPLELEAKADIIMDKEKDRAFIAVNTDNRVYNERYNWIPVCATYKASGKEEYIVVGNFFNNKETQYEKLKKLASMGSAQQVPLAYYYIDQVEVFIMEDPAECACNQGGDQNLESVVYNKNSASEDGFSLEEQVKLATVYFDIKKSKLEPNMTKDLDILVGSLKANPEYKIVLHAHLDADEGSILRKDPEDLVVNDLDLKRAEVVKAYLIEKGLDEGRISIETHKDKEQVAFGTTPLDHAKNRRVEFTLVK